MSEEQNFQIELRIGRERIRLSAQIPETSIALLDLLPLIRSLADLVTQVATREAQALGRPVRCGPGCGACCRQLVPVSPPEALALSRTVGALEPGHRARVLERFSGNRERLTESGLEGQLRQALSQGDGGRDSRRTLGLAYFALSLPCPFLEQESCSIHPQRPLACREYLVSSDPVHCAQPDAETLEVVEMPRRLSVLLSQLAASKIPGQPDWIPLTLALDETLFDAESLANPIGPGPAIFEQLITLLANGPLTGAKRPSQGIP